MSIAGYFIPDARCPKCGYEVSGLTDDLCPECGRQYSLQDAILSGSRFGNVPKVWVQLLSFILVLSIPTTYAILQPSFRYTALGIVYVGVLLLIVELFVLLAAAIPTEHASRRVTVRVVVSHLLILQMSWAVIPLLLLIEHIAPQQLLGLDVMLVVTWLCAFILAPMYFGREMERSFSKLILNGSRAVSITCAIVLAIHLLASLGLAAAAVA